MWYCFLVRCPHCAIDLNDPSPQCPRCGFHIRDLDAVLGDPPPRTGNVVDAAGVFTAADARRLEERLAAFASHTGFEMVVATVSTTKPRLPSEYVFWLFNRWMIGGDRHAGVMILLAMAERRIESEVGHALERVVTDAASTRILEEHAVPFLRAQRYGEGVYHAVDMLARVLENARLVVPEVPKP